MRNRGLRLGVGEGAQGRERAWDGKAVRCVGFRFVAKQGTEVEAQGGAGGTRCDGGGATGGGVVGGGVFGCCLWFTGCLLLQRYLGGSSGTGMAQET